MDSRRSPRKLTLAKRRELKVVAAVAQEEIMQFHVASALRLIELAAGRVSAVRMVAIHTRLHGITGAMAEVLSYSVLAALGNRAARGAAASLVVEGVEGEDSMARDARSLLRMLRGRLRGRVHHDLRRTVELAFGAAQVGLLDLHVDHALRFVRELAETHDTAGAVGVYAAMTGVAPSARHMLYAHVLDRLAAQELPGENTVRAPAAQVASSPRSRRRSRMGQRAVA
jgi:hypothetical protein